MATWAVAHPFGPRIQRFLRAGNFLCQPKLGKLGHWPLYHDHTFLYYSCSICTFLVMRLQFFSKNVPIFSLGVGSALNFSATVQETFLLTHYPLKLQMLFLVRPITDSDLVLSQVSCSRTEGSLSSRGLILRGLLLSTPPPDRSPIGRSVSLVSQPFPHPVLCWEQLLLLSIFRWDQRFNQVRFNYILGLHSLHTDSLSRSQLYYLKYT